MGRFQPLHNGHAQLIQRALADAGDVVVAIGSSTAAESPGDPFSLAERQEMVAAVFPSVPTVAVPDLHDDARWVAHCLARTGPVDCAYGNDPRTMDLFDRAGMRTVRPGLVERPQHEGRRVRALLAAGDPAWRTLVPPPVARLLTHWDAPARLARLHAGLGSSGPRRQA